MHLTCMVPPDGAALPASLHVSKPFFSLSPLLGIEPRAVCILLIELHL
jgi:hypothetical protein